jgi:aconitate hydratase
MAPEHAEQGLPDEVQLRSSSVAATSLQLQKRFFETGARRLCHIDVCSIMGADAYDRMPFVARALAENLLRAGAPQEDILRTLAQRSAPAGTIELPLRIGRVILPDSSGVPVLMDLAALRSALSRRGRSPEIVRSQAPITLIVDHSLQVDVAGQSGAIAVNLDHEYARNGERYRFLKWAQQAFDGLEIYPPGSGIIHQVHLERVAMVACVEEGDDPALVYPDIVVGGDSHTPMVNALGVVGWGVGGLEAEMVALGEPYPLPNPEFVGIELCGELPVGVSTTDLALTITHLLRRHGVIGAFVEFFGPAAHAMSVPDRATLANMAPEYGATTAFWPIDEQTLAYLALTGRAPEHVDLVRAHAQSAGLFRHAGALEPHYDRVIRIELGAVSRSLAGPSKPHRLVDVAGLAGAFANTLGRPIELKASTGIADGAIAIAAITSCTNTANPVAMITAGLIARNAAARGLRPAAYVKTSLAPGSRAVTGYLERAGLLQDLEALGFHVVGYGCTTCGGKSGPLTNDAVDAIADGRAMVAVLSGNRNFDGRIHRLISASFLASPGLVVAYALAGSVMGDLDVDPIASDCDGRDVYLRDLWPDPTEVEDIARRVLTPDLFGTESLLDEASSARWRAVDAPTGALFDWDPTSSYIVEPPFFEKKADGFGTLNEVSGARVLGMFEDGLTTDHVSPGGEIPHDSPAGRYLQAGGVAPVQFNTYVGRRGNHHVMVRGTYANLRLRNLLVPECEGWWTRRFPDGEVVSFFDAANDYKAKGVPLIVLAGRDFGSGSSRDWAAKGPALLGIGAVIAQSFERIHRSNLIGLGILPLLFADGQSVESLGLRGDELFSFTGIQSALASQGFIEANARGADGTIEFQIMIDTRTKAEVNMLLASGVFRAALARLA